MFTTDGTQLRLLVCIASHGTSNDQYLHQLIRTYRGMPYRTHIVVLSNIPKGLDAGVEVLVGLPTKDPWSLPFGHKQLFADRVNDYDLFLYSENDTLVTQRNLDAFLGVTGLLPDDEVAGFFRFEEDIDGKKHYPDVHRTFHWDVESVRTRHGHSFAYFTNEHAAAYVLTRRQLLKAIASGGFLVGPHTGKYDLLVSAATDPYTQCGFTKLLCISHFEDFLIHHLPNKYIHHRLSLDALQFEQQLAQLRLLAEQRTVPAPLLKEHPGFKATDLGPDYYDSPQVEILEAIPTGAKSVLSIGCGWGATEAHIAGLGTSVTAIPMDSVIAACARARGIEVVEGDLGGASQQLAGRTFDCILLRNVLHLFERPAEVLSAMSPFLGRSGRLVVSVPNLSRIPILLRRIRGYEAYKGLGEFPQSGIHFSSRSSLRRWLQAARFSVVREHVILPERAARISSWTLGVADGLLAREIVTVASPAGVPAALLDSGGLTRSAREYPPGASSGGAAYSVAGVPK